ncbi:MAG: ribonuclease Z [Defluviitaleaceae bacterium]|nr:ribonuclease Z [Defluviitaleaceae bacterium]
MLDIALVGTGGMMPMPNRNLSSLACRLNGSMLIIDAGEGTQCSLRTLGWGYKPIDVIVFTHFHADHISGLPGLLLAIGMTRDEPITIIGPAGLERIVRSLCIIAPGLPFDMHFIELPPEGLRDFAIPGTDYILGALPVEHSCPCFAYTIEARRLGRFDLDAAEALDLPRKFWSVLQKGEQVEYEGRIFTPDMVMGAARKGIKIAYCTDSRPTRALPGFIQNADIFICEGMHGDEEKAQKVRRAKHMMYSEAAKLARAGNVSKLWLTHFSPAVIDPRYHLKNARDVFPNTIAGYDRLTETILFSDSE